MKDFLLNNTNKNERFAYISLVVATVLYGTTLTAMKVCLNFYSEVEMITLRMIISSLLFLPFFLTVYKDLKVDKIDFKFILLMTICEPCLYFLFETHALRFTTSGQAGVVSSMEPILIIIFAKFILKEHLPKIAYIGVLLGIIGSVVLSIGSDVNELAPNPILGNSLEMCAEILTVTSIITTKYLMDKYPPFFLAGSQVLLGAVFFIVLNIVRHGSFIPVINESLPILIYLGVLTVVSYALYNYGICTLSASKASPFLYMLPISSICFGCFFLGESFNLTQFFACALIFVGIYISQMKDKRKFVKLRNFLREKNFIKK
ncbi:MAG: DMT family transporter [Candidatus Gastranaerophilaceae bacterium]